MSTVKFVKTHALGNDFILIESGVVAEDHYAAFAQQICDRYFAVGADGAIFWTKQPDRIDLRIFNQDGSEAELSGNGIRCAAAYLVESGLWTKGDIPLRTISGVYTLHRAGTAYEADMGIPALAPKDIPFRSEKPMDRVVDHPFVADGEEVRISLCATGNPHCSLFVPSIDEETVHRLGSRIERHPAFPNRTNVEFIQVLNRAEIQVAFWERGVGPSHASGTGSCGAVVACILNGKTDRRVKVRTIRGGELTVEWPENGRLKLTSTATVVAEGRYYYKP